MAKQFNRFRCKKMVKIVSSNKARNYANYGETYSTTWADSITNKFNLLSLDAKYRFLDSTKNKHRIKQYSTEKFL